MTKRTFRLSLAALALVGVLGACGGSGDDDGGSGGSGEGASGGESDGDGQALYDWVDCMRGEGLENMPDPSRDAAGNLVIAGEGWDIGPTPGEAGFGEYSEEETQAASETCGFPPIMEPGVASDETIEERHQMMLDYAQCMRENGITEFADPDFSNTEAPMRVPEGISDEDPEFVAAQEACQSIMRPEGSEESGEGSEG